MCVGICIKFFAYEHVRASSLLLLCRQQGSNSGLQIGSTYLYLLSHLINLKQYIFSTDFYFLNYFWLIYLCIYLFACLEVFSVLCISVFICIWCLQRPGKGAGTSELELQVFVYLLVGTGNWIWVICKCSLCCRWISLWTITHILMKPMFCL